MISIEKLVFSYGRDVKVFDGLSTEFHEGSIHGLFGSNGIGKSTLLKLMAGVYLPSSGRVVIDSQQPGGLHPSMLRRIMIVPEEFDLPDISFFRFCRQNSPLYPLFSASLLDQAISDLAIDPDARTGSLSMGQRKKAYLAFALACNTQYLFLDEPTNGLDIPSKAALKRLLAAGADEKRTIIISTHQAADLENLIDNVVILDDAGLLLNKSITRIAEKLKFGPVVSGDEVLYCSDSLSGRSGVSVNNGHAETTPDLGHLFCAATANPDRIRQIFES